MSLKQNDIALVTAMLRDVEMKIMDSTTGVARSAGDAYPSKAHNLSCFVTGSISSKYLFFLFILSYASNRSCLVSLNFAILFSSCRDLIWFNVCYHGFNYI